MRILLDECLPKRLKRDLAGHDARTVPEMGWASKRNGELLTLAQADFDVFLTVDRNLSFQQDLGRLKLGVVVLVAKGIGTRIFSLWWRISGRPGRHCTGSTGEGGCVTSACSRRPLAPGSVVPGCRR